MSLPIEYEVDLLKRRIEYLEVREKKLINMIEELVRLTRELQLMQLNSIEK